uniref:Uncharacterized protein n=1 Tax=Clytia hemisphaerica TaxID=252671 RepID=A0A7M5WWZ8_9CNID
MVKIMDPKHTPPVILQSNNPNLHSACIKQAAINGIQMSAAIKLIPAEMSTNFKNMAWACDLKQLRAQMKALPIRTAAHTAIMADAWNDKRVGSASLSISPISMSISTNPSRGMVVSVVKVFKSFPLG